LYKNIWSLKKILLLNVQNIFDVQTVAQLELIFGEERGVTRKSAKGGAIWGRYCTTMDKNKEFTSHFRVVKTPKPPWLLHCVQVYKY